MRRSGTATRKTSPRSPALESLPVRLVRRLALAKGGLLSKAWSGLPDRSPRGEERARQSAHAIIRRFGFLQLDTVSIAGARSHTIVLQSRLPGFPVSLGEDLLQPGEPLFEYWGHEASWIPIELYPAFGFRRREFRAHPWWGDLVRSHPRIAKNLRDRIRAEGPLPSEKLGSKNSSGWWNLGTAKKVAHAMWSSGELAIAKRRHFHRWYDLTERVIPKTWRDREWSEEKSLRALLRLALNAHGWATPATLAATWRLKKRGTAVRKTLETLEARGEIIACQAIDESTNETSKGWILQEDLELAHRLATSRPRRDRGILLSPFDPLLWDRERVRRLFGFHQVLEIYKPAPQRIYGYYCLPILAGDELIGRADLKAHRQRGELEVLSLHFGKDHPGSRPASRDRAAAEWGLQRYGDNVGLRLST